MPYRFRKTKKGIKATKPDGSSIIFHTQSMEEAKRRAKIRESYAHMK